MTDNKRKPPAIDPKKLLDAIQKTIARGLEEDKKPREKKFKYGEGVRDPRDE